MGWTAPPRPDWVRVINEGGAGPISQEAALPLTRDALVAEAGARQGHVFETATACEAAFGHPDFPAAPAFERLDRFLRSVEDEAALAPIGRFAARRFLLRVLESRLQIMDWLRRDPGVQEESIRAPVVIAGAPRTGTTILFALLAADDRLRAPEGWELLRPVPPPAPDPAVNARDPRIPLVDRELGLPQTIAEGLRSIHEWGSRRPKECLSAQTFAFQSEELTARFSVPRFEAWQQRQDPTPAYAMHRLVLQILQRRRPGTRWLLKSPVHLHALPTLFETYPDAQVVVSHRDPLPAIASLTSLIATLRWSHSDAVDPTEIAAAHLDRYAERFERLSEWVEGGVLPSAQTHHFHFQDLVDDPLPSLESLYSALGLPVDAILSARFEEVLRAQPRGRHGGHAYGQDDLGQAPSALRARFARYQSAFQVPDELTS